MMSRLAMHSLFFWPPLRPSFKGVPTMVSARDCRPKLAIRSSTRRKASLRETVLFPVIIPSTPVPELYVSKGEEGRGDFLPGQSKPRCEHHSLADGDASNHGILLLDIDGDGVELHRWRGVPRGDGAHLNVFLAVHLLLGFGMGAIAFDFVHGSQRSQAQENA